MNSRICYSPRDRRDGDPRGRRRGEEFVHVGSSERSARGIGVTAFQDYDLDGPLQPEISWLPISFDRAAGQGCYLMRMQPGAVTIPHDHPGVEDFLMLEGELIDSDGTVFRPGDFVSYAAGTRHNSWTETGCLIAVFEWRRPRTDAS